MLNINCLNPLNRVSWLKMEEAMKFDKNLAKKCLNPLNRVSWLKILMKIISDGDRGQGGVSIPLTGSVG